MSHPPMPPFPRQSAIEKIHLAEDGWNSRDPEKVSLAYALDWRWRNRSEFVNGRQESIALLTHKWAKQLDYRLIKALWAFTGDRIAVRLPMSGMTTRAIGVGLMATKTGSSMRMA